jgi:hypothetical protein
MFYITRQLRCGVVQRSAAVSVKLIDKLHPPLCSGEWGAEKPPHSPHFKEGTVDIQSVTSRVVRLPRITGGYPLLGFYDE